MLYNLLNANLSITADDGATILTPANYLTLAYDPYAQEAQGNQPQIIVGPRKLSIRRPLTLPPIWYEIDDLVRMRVITRKWDGGDFGFTLDGNLTRNKILDGIIQIMASNYTDPDGSHTWSWVRATDDGQNSDENPQGTPLYRTDVTIGCKRYALTH
jgi:hypothetical protein